jgi:hypothetical protein
MSDHLFVITDILEPRKVRSSNDRYGYTKMDNCAKWLTMNNK